MGLLGVAGLHPMRRGRDGRAEDSARARNELMYQGTRHSALSPRRNLFLEAHDEQLGRILRRGDRQQLRSGVTLGMLRTGRRSHNHITVHI